MSSTNEFPKDILPKLEFLQPHQVDEAAKLIAEAFLHETKAHGASPEYAWILEDLLLEEDNIDRRKDQKEALKWLFRKNLGVQAEHDAATNQQTSCHCAFRRVPNNTEPEMICFFILKQVSTKHDDKDDEDNRKISTWTMIRYGILWFPILFGLRVFYRLLVAKKHYEDQLHEYLSDIQEREPKRSSCLVLERMVVHPSMQGKGIGSFFLKQALMTSSANSGDNNDNTPCVIQTQTERNARFYQKLGSKILQKEVYPPSSDITNWILEFRHPKKE